MFAALQLEVERRLLIVKQTLDTLTRLEADASHTPEVLRSLKGLTFVQLYAVYEYCVVTLVQAVIREVNSKGIVVRELRDELLAFALNDDYKSLADCGWGKTWAARLHLINRAKSADPVLVPDNLFPSDGSHFRVDQLRTIWSLFGVTGPCIPENKFIGRIDEIVELRNGIAHGRMKPEDVGARFSVWDLEVRQADTAVLCQFLISTVHLHLIAPNAVQK